MAEQKENFNIRIVRGGGGGEGGGDYIVHSLFLLPSGYIMVKPKFGLFPV